VNQPEQKKKLRIVGAVAVVIVTCVTAIRLLGTSTPPAPTTFAPIEAWQATSVQPSYQVDDSIDLSQLPKLPEPTVYPITPLPDSPTTSFKQLPDSPTASFKQLPALQTPPQSDHLKIEPLPPIDRHDPALKASPHVENETQPRVPKKTQTPTAPETKQEDETNFGIRISNTNRHLKSNRISTSNTEVETPYLRHPITEDFPTPDPTQFRLGDTWGRNSGNGSLTNLLAAASDENTRSTATKEADDRLIHDSTASSRTPETQSYAVVQASAEIELAPVLSALSARSTRLAKQDDELPRLFDDDALESDQSDAPEIKIAALPKPLPQSGSGSTKPKKKKKVVVAASKKDRKKLSAGGKNAKDDYRLAAQPKIGDHYVDDTPQTDSRAQLLAPQPWDFSEDALNPYLSYDAGPQQNVYQGKTLNANQRPLVELGRPWYQLGQLSPGSSVLGFHNNVVPQFLIFGDTRVGYGSNRQNGQTNSVIATQVNLDFDLKLTGTERFHAFISPLGGNQNSRYQFDDDRFVFEGDADIDFGFFEGDLGALVGGAIDKTLPFDLPFTVGIIPLVFQNGIWLEDAFLGFAATIPARNSPRLNISNMDLTFFAGYDKLNSDAFPGDDSAARVVGFASFIEALNGYIEADYAFLDDRTAEDRSYHNIAIGYTRRYGRFLSNSTRVIVNAGQSTEVGPNTADGVLLLSENSLITGQPTNIVPYFNMFAGFDRPQSVARAGASGGILRNTGILFESDNLTGYPTLDATANDTFGFAAGINILSKEFSQQLVLETAMLGVMGDAATRNAQGDQYGVGFRYQLPLSNSVIFRADGMVGFLRNDEDISGIRVEMRKKF
jgi:hypothetical protein